MRSPVIVPYLVQEAAQAQSDRALEMGQDKGNMEQAILEMQKRSEAVSIDPNLLLKRIFGFVTKTQRDTFNVAIFQQRTEANTSSLVMGQGRVQLPAPQLASSVWPCCPVMPSKGQAWLLLALPLV